MDDIDNVVNGAFDMPEDRTGQGLPDFFSNFFHEIGYKIPV